MINNIYIKRDLFCLTFIVVCILVLLSCSKDTEHVVEHVPATIKIATRVSADEDFDNTIRTLRIMSFDPGSTIRNNIFYDEAYLNSNDPIIHEMLSGVYDFIFIANEEPNGGENDELTSSAFGNNKTINDLNTISLPASEINQTNAIPMLTRVNNVTVLPGFEGVKINDENIQTIWSVLMKRLAVRIDITLKSMVDLTDQFKGVIFSNIPDNIPILGNYSGPQNVTKAFTIIDNPENFEEISTEFLWAIKVKRIILPSHIFIPENASSRALIMSLTLAPWNEEIPSATIGIEEPINYTLPPNTQFIGEGIVGPLLSVNLKTLDWDTKDLLGDISGRILNVSAVTASITATQTSRIYFYTNQKTVNIYPIGRLNDSFFDVNNVFDRLTGSIPANFHFDSDTGLGYVDIKRAPLLSTGGEYIIYLNAGGLFRSITVDVSLT